MIMIIQPYCAVEPGLLVNKSTKDYPLQQEKARDLHTNATLYFSGLRIKKGFTTPLKELTFAAKRQQGGKNSKINEPEEEEQASLFSLTSATTSSSSSSVSSVASASGSESEEDEESEGSSLSPCSCL